MTDVTASSEPTRARALTPSSATLFLTLLLALITARSGDASCTSIVVSKGATTDGSVFITYSADAPFVPRFLHVPGGDHEPGTVIDAVSWEDDGIRGKVRQAGRTFGVVGLINERQVALGETTTGGRRELRNPEGLLDYSALMLLTLERAETARDAIRIIDELCNEYGYKSSGETISISDKNEAWILEIIGKGPGVPGAVWVAARVPDGYITAHANMSRIDTFPLDDPDNWRYSEDVIDFAVEQGFFDPSSGQRFSFKNAYHPDPSVVSRRVCGARVWSVYRRACPSTEFASAFHRGIDGAEDYPLFVKPDTKLALADVFALMRDHYEGTELDMTRGIDAGPFASPYRFRNLTWEVDDDTYCWERPISTQQAGFVMVAQSRAWLPDAVGGVYWYTPDDCFTSVFAPFYCSIKRLPGSFTTGDINRFSWDSAWWVFNMVSNKTYDRWSRIFPDVQAAQQEIETTFLDLQPVIDSTAVALLEDNPDLAHEYLTQYSCGNGEELVRRWRELAEFLLTKHNDGYVNDGAGSPRGVGYPEDWLRRVIGENPGRFRLPPKKDDGTQ